MSKLINNAGVQYYANKLCDANNRKVGSKSLPTALDDIDALIDEMETKFNEEYGSPLEMKIQNNESAFIVGTGIDIDKRDEVENSFTDVELSGNSLVNCIRENSLMDANNFIQYENNPVVTEDSITLKSVESEFTRFSPKLDCGVIKPNTTYTIIFNVMDNTLTGDVHLLHTNNDDVCESAFPFQKVCGAGTKDIFKYVLTTPEDLSNCNALFRTLIWNNNKADQLIKFNMMILEGNYSKKPIPHYFQGLKSIGEKENNNHTINISSIGKNFFNFENYCDYECTYAFGYPLETSVRVTSLPEQRFKLLSNGFYFKTIDNSSQNKGIGFYIKVPKNTDYTFSCNVKSNDSKHSIKCQGIFHSEFPVKNHIKRTLFFTDETLENRVVRRFNTLNYDYLFFYIGGAYEENFSGYKEFEFTEIQLTTSTNEDPQFQTYKDDFIQIPLKEPLRAVSDSVKDTIEKIDGEWKLIRRCRERILTGEDLKEFIKGGSVSYVDPLVNRLTFDIDDVNYKGSPIPILCDKFGYLLWHSTADGSNERNTEAICFKSVNELNIHMYKSRLSDQTMAAVRTWLNENPVKVIYELATPIIEDINPVTLQCWKNGVINIDEILPVDTTHTVSLNKPAQIKKNIEELTELRYRVKRLEDTLDNVSLDQTLQLQLLKHSINLDNQEGDEDNANQ